MNFKTTDVMYIVGKRGKGKSLFLDKFMLPNIPRYILQDSATFQHGHMGIIARTVPEVKQLLNKGYNQIVFQSFDDNPEEFDELCKLILTEGNILLAIEEMGNYKDSKYLSRVIRTGRNFGVGLIALNVKTNKVPTVLIAVIDHLIAFNIDFPDDIMFLREYLGDKAYILKNLKVGEYYYKHGDDIIRCAPIPLNL